MNTENLTDDHSKEMDALNAKISELSRMLENTKNSLANEKANCEKIKTDRDDLRKQLLNQDSELKAQSLAATAKTGEFSIQANKIKDLEREIERLNNLLDGKSKAMIANDKTSDIEKLKLALSEANKQVLDANKEIHDTHENLEAQLKENSKCRMKVDSLTLQTTSLEGELKEARDQIAKLKAELHDRTDELHNATDVLVVERDINAKRYASLEASKAIVESDLKASELKATNLLATNESLHQEIFDMVHANEKARIEQDKALTVLNGELREARKTIEELMKKLASTESDRDAEKAKREALEKELAALKDQLKRLEADFKASKDASDKALAASNVNMDKSFKEQLAAKDLLISQKDNEIKILSSKSGADVKRISDAHTAEVIII